MDAVAGDPGGGERRDFGRNRRTGGLPRGHPAGVAPARDPAKTGGSRLLAAVGGSRRGYGRPGPGPPPASRRAARLVVPALAFVVLPVVALAVEAPWSRAGSALGESGAWTALRVSLEVTLGATAISLVVGMPAAWALARVPFPG